jgi:peroxiredoxin Q/BCP
MLKEGDKAPAFALESDSGEVIRLADLRGKRVVVYFYPKDSTPGCTREAQAFTALAEDFAAAGAVVLGISKDSVKSHCSFRDKYELAIPLLSDPELSVHKGFGAFGKKVMYGREVEGTIRSTFVLGPDGVVEKVYPSVKVDGHAEAVLAFLRGEGSAKKAPAAAPAAKKAVATKAAAKTLAAKKAPARAAIEVPSKKAGPRAGLVAESKARKVLPRPAARGQRGRGGR